MLTLAAADATHYFVCGTKGKKSCETWRGKTDGWIRSMHYRIYDAIYNDDTALTATVCKATIIISAKFYKLSTKCISSICLFESVCVYVVVHQHHPPWVHWNYLVQTPVLFYYYPCILCDYFDQRRSWSSIFIFNSLWLNSISTVSSTDVRRYRPS